MSTENNTSMPTKYDPQTIEAGRYEWWLKGKYFEAQPESDKDTLYNCYSTAERHR